MSSHRLFVFSLLFLFSVSKSSAQSLVDEVVVSASLVPLRASEVGSAVSVIDGALLEQRQITTVFDALRDVPGVAVNRTGTLGSLSQIRIRGGEANHALVLLDGVEANDPATSSEFNFAHLSSAGIERIEVLRGPQSALWGADALAGVVNIVSVAPSPGMYARASAEGGGFGTGSLSGRFNAATETGGIVVDGTYLTTAGINIAREGSEKDGYENLSLGARGFIELASNFRLNASIRHVNATSEFDSGFPYPADSDHETDAVQSYGRTEARMRFLDGAVEAVAGAAWTDTRSENFLAGALSDAVEGDKTLFDFKTSAQWPGEMLGAQVRHRLGAVVETAQETFEQRFVEFDLADQNQARRESGVAGEYGLAFDESVFLSFGVRQDWNTRFDDAATWRTTLSALVPGGVARIHASAGTGVKNPDFFELFGFVPSSFAGNPALMPETSFGYDFGLETRFLSDSVLFDVTYFHADLEDEIFTDFATFPTTARNAVGESLRQGVEVSLAARLGEAWTLSSAYAYTESEAAGGATELRRPRHIGSLDLDWNLMGGNASLTIGADFHGSQRDTDFGTFEEVHLPGYVLVRLSGATRITEGWELTGRIENLLGQHYEEVVGYRARGLGAFVGFRARIGE